MMLDHFVDLKIETLWISPFFKSPMLDMGYDVSDYLQIDPVFGTMADFDELLRETKKRGKKSIIIYSYLTNEVYFIYERTILRM